MIFQAQPPAGAGIFFIVPFMVIIGLVIALIYYIRKNKKFKKQIIMLQDNR